MFYRSYSLKFDGVSKPKRTISRGLAIECRHITKQVSVLPQLLVSGIVKQKRGSSGAVY